MAVDANRRLRKNGELSQNAFLRNILGGTTPLNGNLENLLTLEFTSMFGWGNGWGNA